MKTSVKIVILVLAVALVTSSILYFFSMITAPPTSAIISGQHVSDINADIEKINDDISVSSLDDLFVTLDQKIAFWTSNTLVDEPNRDKCLESFLKQYVPVYVDKTKLQLRKKSWGQQEKDRIVNHVNYLRTKELKNDGTQVIGSGNDMSGKLEELEKICDDYADAAKLLKNTQFKNLSDAKKRIQAAESFAEDTYIGHSNLQSHLERFPEKLGESHYKKLTNLLSQLSDWRYETLSTTESNFKLFNTTCDEYKKATVYGGDHPKSVSDMKKNAKSYMSDAYDEKCSLMVDGKSSDMSYSIPTDGGNYSFSVNTNHPDGYSVPSLPDFCTLGTKTNSSFKINVKENTAGSSRSGYIKVTAGNKSIKVNLTQKESEKPSVTISSVTTDHNVTENGQKGMRINVTLKANRMNGKNLDVVAWFYYQDGSKVKDRNNRFHTSDGQVANSEYAYLSSDNKTISIFLPYSELHITGAGTYDLKFKIGVFDADKQLTTSSYYNFTLTNS